MIDSTERMLIKQQIAAARAVLMLLDSHPLETLETSCTQMQAVTRLKNTTERLARNIHTGAHLLTEQTTESN